MCVCAREREKFIAHNYYIDNIEHRCHSTYINSKGVLHFQDYQNHEVKPFAWMYPYLNSIVSCYPQCIVGVN